MQSFLKYYINYIKERRQKDLYRQTHIYDRQEYRVNLSSNDYLGLSTHPLILQQAHDWGIRYGTGATASPLITGYSHATALLEERLASLKGKEVALIFPSGFQTNYSVLNAVLDKSVLGREPLVLVDKYAHASMIAGCVSAHVRVIRYAHNDMNHLAALLKKYAHGQPVFIITESVFSMDGDVTDGQILSDLAHAYDACVIVDDAHATGILGENGRGLAHEWKKADIIIGTGGKALGMMGGFICCSRVMRDYLVQKAGGYIYSTGVSPILLGGLNAALDLLPTLEEKRQSVSVCATEWRRHFLEHGLDIGHSTTHIIPIIIGNSGHTLNAADQLRRAGFLVHAFRPPTVPLGTSRLRLSLTPLIEPEIVTELTKIIIESIRQ